MSGPLETVLTVVAGRAMLKERRFKWGEAIPQFSVGSQGDWIVAAPGVAGIHLLLTFDGRQMHAASVNDNAPVYLKDRPIDKNWNALVVGSELRFGEAKLVVACEPAETRAHSHSKPPDVSASQVPAVAVQRPALNANANLPAAHPSPPPVNNLAAPAAASTNEHESGGTQLIEDYRGELERQRTQEQPAFQAANPPLRVLGGPPTSPMAPALGSAAPLNQTLPLQQNPAAPPNIGFGNAAGGLNSTARISPDPAPPVPAAHAPLADAASPAPGNSPSAPPGYGSGFHAQPPAVPGPPQHGSVPPGYASSPPPTYPTAPPAAPTRSPGTVADSTSSRPPALQHLAMTVGVPAQPRISEPPNPYQTLPSESRAGAQAGVPTGPAPLGTAPASGMPPAPVELSMDQATVVEKASPIFRQPGVMPGGVTPGTPHMPKVQAAGVAFAPTEAQPVMPTDPTAGANTLPPMTPAQAPISDSPPVSEGPFSTLSDGGALRDFAAQIPPSPPDPGPPPAPSPAAGTPAFAAQGSAPPGAPSPNYYSEPHLEPVQAQPEKPKTSVVKKVTLALFLVAAGLMVYGQFVMPRLASRSARSAVKASASAARAATSTQKAAAVLKANGTASAQASASAVASGGIPAAEERDAPPKQDAPTKGADSAATPEPAEKAAPPMQAETAADPGTVAASRAALDAAFEGRLEEAKAEYAKLSETANAPLYLLATQHLERGSVRRP